MIENQHWRKSGFTIGWILLLSSSLALLIAGSRERHWMYEKAFVEGSIWVYGGMLVAALAILLILCGRGWWRILLEVVAFIELYCWFSWLAWAVQMR